MNEQDFIDFLMGALADDTSGMVKVAEIQEHGLLVTMLDNSQFVLTVEKQNICFD